MATSPRDSDGTDALKASATPTPTSGSGSGPAVSAAPTSGSDSGPAASAASARRASSAGDGARNSNDHVAAIVGELASADDSPDAPRRSSRLLAALTGILRRGAAGSGRSVRFTVQRLTDEVLEMAPRLPVRDQETLRRQHPTLSTDELADALIEGAARASGAVGAAVGVWAVLPIAPLFAVEVAAETVAVVGIEIKLIAELHEVYGLRPPGSRVSRMAGYTAAWADRRGVSLAPGSIAVAIGPALRTRLTRRLTRRAGRSTLSLSPLLTGAAAGAWANRRETRRLGEVIRTQLRRAAEARRSSEG